MGPMLLSLPPTVELVIELEDVRKLYPVAGQSPILAVDGVSFSVARGEVLALVGTSGSGKTTTMKMINRLVEPTSGTIRIDGEDTSSMDPVALRRRMGYVIQKGGLFPHMTVARNVGLLCELEGWETSRTQERVESLLELVNLEPSQFAHRYPGELSGGQRQRVGVARALALDPPFVLLDEPFGALDPITRRQLHREFQQLRERVAKTMVLVTHDMGEAFVLSDRVALMDEGKIVQLGKEADFRDEPASDFVREFFAGA